MCNLPPIAVNTGFKYSIRAIRKQEALWTCGVELTASVKILHLLAIISFKPKVFVIREALYVLACALISMNNNNLQSVKKVCNTVLYIL